MPWFLHQHCILQMFGLLFCSRMLLASDGDNYSAAILERSGVVLNITFTREREGNGKKDRRTGAKWQIQVISFIWKNGWTFGKSDMRRSMDKTTQHEWLQILKKSSTICAQCIIIGIISNCECKGCYCRTFKITCSAQSGSPGIGLWSIRQLFEKA